MRITKQSIEFFNSRIDWQDVADLRQTNDSLIVLLTDGSQVELRGVHPTVEDEAFRLFNQFKSH